MLHSKKANVSLMNSCIKILEEVHYHRTDKIQGDADKKLDVRHGSRYVPHRIIGCCKLMARYPAITGTAYCIEQTG
jgi:hypothetical protein